MQVKKLREKKKTKVVSTMTLHINYNLISSYKRRWYQCLPPILMAAFPAVSQRSGEPSPPLIARKSLGIVKNSEIPAAAESAT